MAYKDEDIRDFATKTSWYGRMSCGDGDDAVDKERDSKQEQFEPAGQSHLSRDNEIVVSIIGNCGSGKLRITCL